MARNDKRFKIPKKIAGIKLSKRTRKTVNSLIEYLDSPAAKALIGSAVAATVANREDRARPSKRS